VSAPRCKRARIGLHEPTKLAEEDAQTLLEGTTAISDDEQMPVTHHEHMTAAIWNHSQCVRSIVF
jgi:hypothetical protein